MLEFKTSAKSKAKKVEPVVFKIDGEEFTAHAPKDSALALLVASGASTDASEQMHELLQFFKAVLDGDSFARFVNLLRSRESNFDLGNATEVLQGLITEFSGRPTE